MATKKAKAAQPSAEYAELQNYLDTLQNPPRKFERGQIVKGKIIENREGEIIIDVGGRTEGVAAGREMKLEGERLDKKAGDEILVYVIKPENEKGQIELSIRRTGTARKWHDLTEAKTNSKAIKVKVIEANTGGVMVEIYPGLRGFVPSSHLENRRIFPSGGYQDKSEATQQLQGKLAELIGQELEVMVMEIDREKNRVILSEKYVSAEANPELRQATLDRIKSGAILDGEITGIAPFGLFVSAEGLEGLVHLSEISWDKVSNPGDFYSVGNKVKVQVIGIDDGGKRIAYSIKRLLPDPWDEVIKKYALGQIIEGEITKIVDYGAFVRIEDGLNGLIHISELSNKLVKDPSEIVKEGERRQVKIIAMSREERHLGLSIRQLEEGAEKKSRRRPAVDAISGESAPEMARLEEILQSNQE